MLLFLCLFVLALIAFMTCFWRFKKSRKEAAQDHSYIIWKDYALPVPNQVEENSASVPKSPAKPSAAEEKIVPPDDDQSSAIKAVLDFEDTQG